MMFDHKNLATESAVLSCGFNIYGFAKVVYANRSLAITWGGGHIFKPLPTLRIGLYGTFTGCSFGRTSSETVFTLSHASQALMKFLFV